MTVDSYLLLRPLASTLGTIVILPLSSRLARWCFRRLCLCKDSTDAMEMPMVPEVVVDLSDRDGKKTTTRSATPSDQSTAPPSPIVFPAYHDELAASVVDRLQRMVITAHIRLSMSESFSAGLSFSGETLTQQEWVVFCHPIQDPTGALFVTLLSVRRNKPRSDEAFLPSPYHEQLTQPVRRDAAARYATVAKFNAHSTGASNMLLLRTLLEEFLLPEELPRYEPEWRNELLRLQEAETRIAVEEPLLSLVNYNPLTLAESLLFEQVALEIITKAEALVMKGCLFFFLGCCLLNKTQDVMEGLAESVEVETVAVALVAVIHTCRFASKLPAILYKPDCPPAVEQVASILLDNATSSHAGILRTGPYMERRIMHDNHPVRRFLDPEVLTVAKSVYGEYV